MKSPSWYRSFTELSSHEREGSDFTRKAWKRRSAWVIVAPHGGGIEPGTSELARAIAGRTHSCYVFEGLKSQGNEVLHITSTLFDDPKCIELVHASSFVVSIHGSGGAEPAVLVGGAHEGLKQLILQALQAAGFDARMAPEDLSGSQPENICNRGRSGAGLQLELTEGLRRQMFKGLRRREREITTSTFRDFVKAVQSTLGTASKQPHPSA